MYHNELWNHVSFAVSLLPLFFMVGFAPHPPFPTPFSSLPLLFLLYIVRSFLLNCNFAPDIDFPYRTRHGHFYKGSGQIMRANIIC
ncbi:hypothetical protein F4779DRAFT_444882 [Xylariaceae sp. FL0662B]|nr:hypothetical protein F4779DRAFT_444882 [Xylariaceae sp. FL0662B]